MWNSKGDSLKAATELPKGELWSDFGGTASPKFASFDNILVRECATALKKFAKDHPKEFGVSKSFSSQAEIIALASFYKLERLPLHIKFLAGSRAEVVAHKLSLSID